MIEESFDIFTLGYDKNLLKQDEFYDDGLPINIVDGLSPILLGSGDMAGNISLTGGYIESSNFVAGTLGWQLTPTSGEMNFAISIDSLNIPNAITADSFHTDEDGNSWWGCNVANFASDNDNANAYVLKDGSAKFQKVRIDGGVDVVFISDTFDTSAKKVLKDFTFDDTDYAGAFKTGDITWSTADGSITGGSGILINAAGIVGAASGTTTFSVNAVTGSAVFAGTIQSSSGYFGNVTNGVNLAANGLELNGTGYVRTGSSGARCELVRSMTGGYNHAFVVYQHDGDVTFRLAADGGSPNLTMFGRGYGCMQMLDEGSGTSANMAKITATGINNALYIETDGSSSVDREDVAAIFIENLSYYGDGIHIANADDGAESWDSRGNLIFLGNRYNSGHYNKIHFEDTSWSAIDEARITNENFLQFPAYYHCSEFDERISGYVSLASTVIANAYWEGGGTNGTQELQAGSNKDRKTYVLLETTFTANSTSTLTFGRQVTKSIACVEFRALMDDNTNTEIKAGFDNVYFTFDTDRDAANIYITDGTRYVDTGVNINIGFYKRFRIFIYPSDVCRAYIDDYLVYNGSGLDFSTSSKRPYFYVDNKSSEENKELFIDYVKIWSGRVGSDDDL